MNNRTRHSRLLPRAFTLIEVLVVLVILGIASAVIIPQITSRDDLKAAAGARVVMADLIYAQNRAIVTQKQHIVVFNGQTYTIYSRDSDTAPLTNIEQPVTHSSSYATTFGAGAPPGGLQQVSLGTITFAGNTTAIGFDELGAPFGYASSTNTRTAFTTAGTIVVGCGSASLTISIQPYTGEASVN
jgi:prepilin-type N-terminal cleavage/methylation domain-containing protein